MNRLVAPLARYGFPFGLGLAALLMVYGRFVLQARDAVAEASAARTAGDSISATRAYRDALRAYVPGSPFEERALAGLTEIATAARATGDTATEHRAWEAMRLGLLGTRSLFIPHPSRYQQATRRLAELDSQPDVTPKAPELATVSSRGNGPGRSVRPLGPAIASTLVGLAGFALWTGATILMIRRGLERDSRKERTRAGVRAAVPVARPARLLAALPAAVLPLIFLAGFALFLAGLRFS